MENFLYILAVVAVDNVVIDRIWLITRRMFFYQCILVTIRFTNWFTYWEIQQIDQTDTQHETSILSKLYLSCWYKKKDFLLFKLFYILQLDFNKVWFWVRNLLLTVLSLCLFLSFWVLIFLLLMSLPLHFRIVV